MYRLYLKCVLLCCEEVSTEVLALSIFFNKEIKNPLLLIVFPENLFYSHVCTHTHTPITIPLFVDLYSSLLTLSDLYTNTHNLFYCYYYCYLLCYY